jgi:ADP-ribosylglycohydrolase
MNPQFVDRVRGALWGIFIADALSMPVHWYYDVSALKRDFGTITDYQAPKQRHPGAAQGQVHDGSSASSTSVAKFRRCICTPCAPEPHFHIC